jgi:hypothetical protein
VCGGEQREWEGVDESGWRWDDDDEEEEEVRTGTWLEGMLGCRERLEYRGRDGEGKKSGIVRRHRLGARWILLTIV